MQQYRITGCAVVFNDEKRILLKKDPKRGWELPGGHVEINESIPATVIREVKEETGIDVEVIKFCGISQDAKRNVCHTFWIAKSVGGKFITCEESLDVNFFNIEDSLRLIQRQDFRDELQKCLDEHAHPFFILLNE